MITRRSIALAAVLLPAVMPAHAQPAPLYQSRVIVTGTDSRERPSGLARCLVDVLVKVSGDFGLRDDPRVQALAATAPSLIEDFDYQDRMGHLPTQDEQGSRDRPYTLTCRFQPRKVNATLRQLGTRPWQSPRPRLLARVMLTDRSGDTYPLLADTAKGDGPRAALIDAAERSGMRVTLPLLGQTRLPPLLPLEGTLRWSDAEFGWVAEWQLSHQARAYRWRVAGVSYDAAMRNGLEGAAAVLSGHAARLAP